jgi:hypothetical protein
MPAIQLGILLLDASGSMAGPVSGAPGAETKAWQIEQMLCSPLAEPLGPEVDRAALLDDCGLIAQLQASKRAESIDLTVIRFDHEVVPYPVQGKLYQPIEDWSLSPAGTRLEPQPPRGGERYWLGGRPFNLLDGMGGMTSIAGALEYADKVARSWIEFQEQALPMYDPLVTIMLMSDMWVDEEPRDKNGAHRVRAIEVAQEIKRTAMVTDRDRPQVLLAAAAFGNDADIDLMRRLASPGPPEAPEKYSLRTANPPDLRLFFLTSMTERWRVGRGVAR